MIEKFKENFKSFLESIKSFKKYKNSFTNTPFNYEKNEKNEKKYNCENNIDINIAYKILNDCNNENFMKNYKKLIYRNHPDRGGSEYIASMITKAKDFIKEYTSPL